MSAASSIQWQVPTHHTDAWIPGRPFFQLSSAAPAASGKHLLRTHTHTLTDAHTLMVVYPAVPFPGVHRSASSQQQANAEHRQLLHSAHTTHGPAAGTGPPWKPPGMTLEE
eukprot:225600-Pelagomonas_calceolata.AAC.1